MGRSEQQDTERERYAAMSRPRKVGLLALAAVCAVIAALAGGYLFGGGSSAGISIAVGLAVVAALAVKYRDTW